MSSFTDLQLNDDENLDENDDEDDALSSLGSSRQRSSTNHYDGGVMRAVEIVWNE